MWGFFRVYLYRSLDLVPAFGRTNGLLFNRRIVAKCLQAHCPPKHLDPSSTPTLGHCQATSLAMWKRLVWACVRWGQEFLNLWLMEVDGNFSAHFPGCYIWAYSLGPSFWQCVQKIHFILKAETWILQNIHLNQNPSVHQISSSTFQPNIKYPPLCPFHPASLPLQKCQTSFQNTVPALHASFRSLAAAAPGLKWKLSCKLHQHWVYSSLPNLSLTSKVYMDKLLKILKGELPSKWLVSGKTQHEPHPPTKSSKKFHHTTVYTPLPHDPSKQK